MQRDTSPTIDVPTKRRKVHKGTKNCWECKRRKVSCTFSQPKACDNCIRRKATCISQEYVSESEMLSNRATEVEARLGRVEELLERLVSNPSGKASQHRDHETTASSSPGALHTPSSIARSPQGCAITANTGISQELMTVRPNQEDLDRIYELPYGLATHLHMTMCTEGFDIGNREPASSREMLQLPPLNAHPVILSKKLLSLASLLQGALSLSHLVVANQSHFSTLMTRAFDKAVQLVTTNDELTTSIEGLQCILIEAMILNNSSSLHKAWLYIHRASAVAQMLGIHRCQSTISLKFHEETTKTDFDLDEFCFVIMNMDCYLSITLGLPRSSFESRALAPEALARCHPLERLARMQCIIADRIMRKKEGDLSTQMAGINEIEQMLQDAAAQMPSKWWLVPEFEVKDNDTSNPFRDIGRVNYQFAHYLLTLRLHLPFLLRTPPGGTFEHNKFIAASTCRDILNLYVTFLKWNTGLCYCRSIDYLIFVSITTLCVAHINARSTNKTPSATSSVERSLLQSRIRDRGLMESTHQVFLRMKEDSIASKLGRITQHLLDVEAESTKGIEYSTTTTAAEITATGGEGDYIDGINGYQLRMPFFGVIKLQRKPVSIPLNYPTYVEQYPVHPEVPSNAILEDVNSGWTQQPWPSNDESGSAIRLSGYRRLDFAEYQRFAV